MIVSHEELIGVFTRIRSAPVWARKQALPRSDAHRASVTRPTPAGTQSAGAEGRRPRDEVDLLAMLASGCGLQVEVR